MNIHTTTTPIAFWKRVLAFLLAGLMTWPHGVLLAQTVPAGSTNTTVVPNGSGNGVPVVNIAAPNAAGLSHNQFNSYNVPVQGQILNNSNATTAQTQLGGVILGNPNLAGRSPATIILNEVVQPNRSMLQGYQEVAGQSAQVIIANPYGITCTGCGFINTPRATLTTGTPNIDAAGNLTGFAVRMGDILINGAGLDAGAQNFFEIVSRSVVLQGQVNARDLLVAAGSNDFDYAARTVTPAAASGTAPTYAIDSSALGGMYVDRIRLIATEAGIGVRLLGDVGASVDDITLSATGRIELLNRMSAQRDIAVNYIGSATPGAVSVGGDAQIYANRNLGIAGGAGDIALGNALVGAGGNLGLTGAALSDTGGASNYRFADGTLTVNVAGAASLGAATYDASGTLSLSGASMDLGTSAIFGRSAASGISIAATGGSLAVSGSQLSSSGSIVLSGTTGVSVATAGFVTSDADVTVTYGGAQFTNQGTFVADGNLQITNTQASAHIRNFGTLFAAGSMTLGSGSLAQFTTEDGSSTLAATLTVNAPRIVSSGYLQADSATLVEGTDLSIGATGVTVLGTAASHANELKLNFLSNQGMLYSAGNLTLTTAQISNQGQIVVDGTLAASADRAPVGPLVNIITHTGAIDAKDLTLTAPTIDLTGGTVYASNDASVTATGTLTMGDSLFAKNDLTVEAGTLGDTVAGATRAAGWNFTITTASDLNLNAGQVYDAGKKLTVNAPNVNIATSASATNTTLSAGGTSSTEGIFINTGALTLGGATAAGSLQSAGDINLAPSVSSLSVVVNNQSGHLSSIQAGGDLSARGDSFTVNGDVLANGDITLKPVANGGTSSLVINNGAWMESAGTLSLTAGQFNARGFSTTINPGGYLAGNNFDIFNGNLTIGNTGVLQGGTVGGNIDVETLNLSGSSSQLRANRGASAQSTIRIGGTGTAPFNNFGLLYAVGNLTLYTNGDIFNTTLGTIASGFGNLQINTRNQSWGANGRFDNQGYVYAGGNLELYIPQDGTLYNHPGATIGAGGNATLGIYYNPLNPEPPYGSTFRNDGRVEVDGDASINASTFLNNIPTNVVRNTTHIGETRTATGDSGRYGTDAPSLGWDALASLASGIGTGAHDGGRTNYLGSGVDYYMVNGNPARLFRDFRVAWTEQDNYTNPGAVAPTIAAGGTLTIRTHTGENKGGDIYGGNLEIRKLHPSLSGSSFANQAVTLYSYDMRLYGREVYSCGADLSCITATPSTLGDLYASFWPSDPSWPNNVIFQPGPGWLANDNVAIQVSSTPIGTKAASLRAAGTFYSEIGSLTIVASTENVASNLIPPGAAAPKPAAPIAQAAQQVIQNGPAPVGIDAENLTLPSGPNGQFVLNTSPNAKYLIESNPLYLSAYNPFLGSEYLAGLLELNPAEEYLRLGDANYEARLIREQVLAQTGASILRTAYDTNDQQKLLMDNAVLEVKELKLNWGTALTSAQVASLKHDIVWMVEQKVQGKSVLVPVVYLTDATRANVSGASIVAQNAVVKGDSFLNKGGQVQASNQLVIVTRKDIVNISGEISGGNVQMQSLEGDIVNRTETIRSGEAGNFTTTAGRSGGIYASGDLFLKAGRDVNVLGAEVIAGGQATVVGGRDVNVSALVLDARTTNFADRSSIGNKDVSRVVETTQTAQNATISGGAGTVLIAKQDVNVTGAYVGSKDGTTTLISESGNVNINTLQLTNTRTESSEKVGFFGEGRVGATASGQDAAVPQTQLTGQAGTGRAGSQGTADSLVQRGTQKPAADPKATSVEGFAGVAIQTSQSSSSATGNMGSIVEGGGVNIIAKSGDVNITGSQVNSGAQGTLIDAARDVNIMAAYDTASSSRKEETVRVGVAGEAGPGGAFAGLKVDGNTLDSQTSSRTAGVSSLGSQGSINIRAGGTLTNEGTSIDAAQNVNVQAAKVDNRAAQNTTTSNVRSSNFNVDLMGGVTTGGIGESVAGLAQGTSQELNIGSPEAQARLRASGGSSTTTGSTSTAVVTQIRSGGNTNFQVSGAMLDEGTSYDAGRNINMDVGSYANRQATNTSTGTVNSTSGGGTLSVGVDASSSVNANVGVQGRNEQSSTSSSTAVVGGLKAGGSVNITSRGDVTLQGTKVEAKDNVNVNAAGNLNLLQANNTSSTKSNTTEGSANLSASACLDLACASAGGGASARGTTLDESTTTGVAGSLSGANVNLRSGGNMTLQGTNIAAQNDTNLSAGGNVDFQALTSTISSRSTADGGGANLSLNVGASGKVATDGGGAGGVNFERGRGSTEGTTRQGGTVTSGGTFSVTSGGNTRLEGTQVSAGSANLNVGGNFTMESAQSTLVQDNSNVTGGVQASAGKSADGGRNFGGAISLDVTKQTADNLTNQNAGITTSGTTTLNVGGNATLSGANIAAGGGVQGQVQGNLLIETRADREKTEDTSFRGYVGVGNIQTSGSGSGGAKPSTANKIDAAQDKFGNVANTAGGTGVFINLQSQTKDNVTIGQQSGISGGAGGLGGLSVGGNATLSGAANSQGINVQGTTTTTGGPQTRQESSSTDFALRGTVASAAGSDQGSGGTFSNVFQASGGSKPGATPDTGPATRPRSGAVSGEDARPTGLARPQAGSGAVTLTRPSDNGPSGSFQPPVKPGAAPSTFTPTSRPRADAVSGDAARPILAPGAVPPGRDRSPSVGPESNPNLKPRPDFVPPTMSGPSPRGTTFTPDSSAPGRPRSESNAPDARPTGQEQFGAFPAPAKPGAVPSTFNPNGPDLDATGRARSDTFVVVPDAAVAGRARSDTFVVVPDAAVAGRARSDTFVVVPDAAVAGRARSDTFVVVPDADVAGRARSDTFVVRPDADVAGRARSDTFVVVPDADVAGRDRSESFGDLTRPTGSEQFGSFAPPDKPGAASSTFTERPAFVPGVIPSPDAVTNVKPAPTPFLRGVTPSLDDVTNVKSPVTPFLPGVMPAQDAVTNLKPGVFVPGVTPRPNEITNLKPDADASGFVPGNKPSDDRLTNVKPAANDPGKAVVVATIKPTANDTSRPAMPTLAPGLSWSKDGKFKLRDLGSEYKGEDKGQGQRWLNDREKKGTVNVQYFDARQREAAEVVIQGGKFYSKKIDATGNVIKGQDGQPELDPFNSMRPDGRDGAIFVMDGDGRIYATNKQEEGRIHHSSLLGGEPIAMGGEMTVIKGELKGINNVSGHYKPDVDQFSRMQAYLRDDLKVDMTGVEARAITPGYRPEDKAHKEQVAIEFDMNTGKVKDVHWRKPVNPDGRVASDGFRLSEPVHPNNEQPRKLSEADRNRLEIVTDEKGNLVYRSDPSKLFDTGSEGSRAIFAIDEQGRMFASDASRSDPAFMHSTLVDGKEVRVAGEIQVRNGKLIDVNNRSAEYPSSPAQAIAGAQDFVYGAKPADATQVRGFTMFEAHFVDNPDGSKRPVMLMLDAKDRTTIKEIQDPGPPPASIVSPRGDAALRSRMDVFFWSRAA